jgi:hypothetical protein
MAKKKLDDINKTGGDIKNTFAEVGNLINELNANLEKTLKLTQGVSDNMSESNDLGQESIGKEAQKEKVLSKIKGLKGDEQKQLLAGLKTGKGLNKDLMAKLGIEGKAGTLAGTAAAMKLKSLGISKEQVKIATVNVKLINAMNAALDVFITQLMAVDKETTEMAKNLNLSKGEAINLKKNFAAIALSSGDIRINSVRLGKANAALNTQLGTGVVFAGNMLTTFSKLTEIVGISAEAAGNLAFQAQNSGKSFREVEENVLGASYEMQRGVGIQLDMKGVLEATGKVTGQVRANLGATPALIAKAVTAAKLLGAELEDIVAAGKAQLDFESSIEAELEAELLTGKQLNLERMRAAALAGDQATVAAELAKNVGTHAEFSKMNVLQQDALAKSMGMSTDAMADMLFKQETMGMNAKQLRAQGKGELADKLELLDAEERRNLAMEKFQATIGDVASALLPMVEFLGKAFEYVAGLKVVMVPLVGVMTALATAAGMFAVKAGIAATKSMVKAAAETFGSFAKIPFGIGIPLAIGAVASMFAMLSKPPKVKDGFAPSNKGPFTIMDNYGAMATTTPGDSLQATGGGGAKASSQPIVIQNKIDPYTMANGGKPRGGFGAIQETQASPTMA